MYVLFVLLPAISAIRYSLLRWDGLSAPVFIGLRNFKNLFSPDSPFLSALGHNLFLTFVPGILILILALSFANAIHRGIRGARLFRIAFFFPNVISSVAIALLWSLLYSTTGAGLINAALKPLLHLHNAIPFTESSRLLSALIPMIVWSSTGFYMVLFLAKMESIPESFYEAARLDGASGSVLFWRITLPLMWDVFSVGIIFMVISGLKLFDSVWVMENGRPSNSTHTMSTLMYSRVFEEYNIGSGSATAVMLFILLLLATLLSRKLLQRESLEY